MLTPPLDTRSVPVIDCKEKLLHHKVILGCTITSDNFISIDLAMCAGCFIIFLVQGKYNSANAETDVGKSSVVMFCQL